MAILTTDQSNPGRRLCQQFSVAVGLDSGSADHVGAEGKRAVKFRLLKNCLVDKRLGAVVKRPGSLNESPGSSLGVPTGIGEYVTETDSSIPLLRTLLFSFAGSTWKQLQGTTWSTVSTTARTSFSTTRQMQFAKIGENLYIAGGRPAKWGGPGTSIERMGIVPPTTAPSAEAPDYLLPGDGIELAQGTQYMYTFYNSSIGLESDWSELSESTGALGSAGAGVPHITVTLPSATAQNWDKIKLYRTLDGGVYPYLVATLEAGTTTYNDTLTDAQLTQAAAPQYDRAIPPANAFVCAKYAQCIWMVDASNPYKLTFSKPYTGSDVDLEYFPVDNYVISNEPITALYVVPGKMLVFHPRGISYVSGTSADDFVFLPFVPGVGTLFPHSISSSGTHLVWLAEQGLVAMRHNGRDPFHISRAIDEELQPLLAAFYNNQIYVSSCWNVSLRQFVFMVNARSNASAPWEEYGTGITTSAIAGWESVAIGNPEDFWEDSANPSATDSMRIKIWGWSPELTELFEEPVWHEYTFSDLADSNSSGAYPTFVFHPQPSSDTSDPQQDKTFLGFFNGTQGGVKTIFRRDRATDNGSAFTAELITDRIVVGAMNGGYKMFHGIGFANSYSDPTSDSLATIKYLKDFDDPQLRSYAGSLITVSDSTDLKKFPQMLARHIHIYISDTSQSLSKILLGEFFIHYRERFRKEGR